MSIQYVGDRVIAHRNGSIEELPMLRTFIGKANEVGWSMIPDATMASYILRAIHTQQRLNEADVGYTFIFHHRPDSWGGSNLADFNELGTLEPGRF